jgi:hypothetical protein
MTTEADTLAAHVAAFRESGAWQADPVRFRFLESLSVRMQGQPDAVREVLQQRLRGALDDFTQAVVAKVGASPAGVRAAEPAPSSLAALAASLQQRHAPVDDEAPDELASVRRFRQSWESGRTLDRLEQALARSPAKPGPLNSHALVVRSLALMGDASVDYLRRFLTYAETLQWLEAAKEQVPQGKGAKAAARKKKGR